MTMNYKAAVELWDLAQEKGDTNLYQVILICVACEGQEGHFREMLSNGAPSEGDVQ